MRHKITYYYSSKATRKDVFFGKLITLIIWIFLLLLCYLGAQIRNSFIALIFMILGFFVLLGFPSFTGVIIDEVMQRRVNRDYNRDVFKYKP